MLSVKVLFIQYEEFTILQNSDNNRVHVSDTNAYPDTTRRDDVGCHAWWEGPCSATYDAPDGNSYAR